MSSIKSRLLDDIKSSMKSREKDRLKTLRLISAAIKQQEVDERCDLTDDGVIATLDKMLKQRRESISQYQKADRADLVAQEESEVMIITEYLPAALTDDELDKLISSAIEANGATSMKDMGKVMGDLRPKVQGRADMSAVSARIKTLLS